MTRDYGRRSEVVGQASTALCGGALALCVLLVIGLLGLLAVEGMAYFWPRPLEQFELRDGSHVLGEVVEIDHTILPEEEEVTTRLRVKTGNRDLTGADFRWIREDEIVRRSEPADALLLERLEWGPFYGRLVGLRRDGDALADSSSAAWDELRRRLPLKRAELERTKDVERGPTGEVNRGVDPRRP